MTPLCIRCHRRERAPGLFVCVDCAERLVAQDPKVPEWRKRLTARDETGRLAA